MTFDWTMRAGGGRVWSNGCVTVAANHVMEQVARNGSIGNGAFSVQHKEQSIYYDELVIASDEFLIYDLFT